MAVLATLSTARSGHLIAQGHSTAAALTSGYHLAFWIAAGLIVAALAVVPFVLGDTRQIEPEGASHSPAGA